MTSHLATLALSLAFMGFPSSTADHPDPYNGQHIEYFAQSGCANDTKPSMPYGMYYETCFNVTHTSAKCGNPGLAWPTRPCLSEMARPNMIM